MPPAPSGAIISKEPSLLPGARAIVDRNYTSQISFPLLLVIPPIRNALQKSVSNANNDISQIQFVGREGCDKVRRFGLWPGKIQQHHFRVLLHSFENNVAAVRGNIEVTNIEIGSEVRQLPLGARLQVDQPEILMLNLPSQ
jgi:hypothetical protein